MRDDARSNDQESEGEEEENGTDSDEEQEVEEDEDDEMSYAECWRAFKSGCKQWSEQNMLSLIWVIRILMAPICGLVSGFCRIPILMGQILFVYGCTALPSYLLKSRTGVDVKEVVQNPAKLMKTGTTIVYFVFILCSIIGRIASSWVFPGQRNPRIVDSEL